MRGKSVIAAEEHAQKIRAVVDRRGDRRFAVIARTDSIATHGIDEAIRRGNLYRAAGADLIFADAPDTKDEIRRLASEIDAPVSVNMIEGGKTPILTLEEAKALGVASVEYPLTAIFSAAKAMERSFAALLGQGNSIGLTDDLMPFGPFTELLGLEAKYQLDEKYAAGKD